MSSKGNERKKFIRRPDLSLPIRLYIAFMALQYKGNLWGKITELARQFMISRVFVYILARSLEESLPAIFGEAGLNEYITEKKQSYQYILSLRLEGRCSIQAISTIMKRFDIDYSSTGYISQILGRIGSLLPDTLSTPDSEVRVVVFASDEVFSKNTPILVTVDPVSSAILKIELADTRKVEDWKKHWKCLENNGYIAAYLVCDEGKSLSLAKKEALADVFRQSDTYHAIAHQLGKWVDILEKQAYKAIEEEDHCERIFDSAKSERVIYKRIVAYEQARKDAEDKIEIYENFCFIYRMLIRELDLFDDNGDLRNRKKAEKNIVVALDLLTTLKIKKITKAVEKARRTVPDLLNYFDVAASVLSDLNQLPISPKALQLLCLAWQWRKKRIKAKQANRRRYCEGNELFYLELAEEFHKDDYNFYQKKVYQELDKIIQSSALVECINSIIRPYLNTSKNQITQETLNLIMFYHNHRRYKDGERKNKTPYEILTGEEKQEKDWIELLFEVIEKQDPTFFLFSGKK